MTIPAFIESLKLRGIELRIEGGALKVKAPTGVVSADLRLQLRDLKPEIIRYLSGTSAALDQADPPDLVAPPTPPPFISPATDTDDAAPKGPFKVFDDFPDGRMVVIETEAEWNALVQHLNQLSQFERHRSKCPQQ